MGKKEKKVYPRTKIETDPHSKEFSLDQRLEKITNNDLETISVWLHNSFLDKKDQNENPFDEDRAYTSTTTLPKLYFAAQPKEKSKIENALKKVLNDAIAQFDYETVMHVILGIGIIELPVPFLPLIKFIEDHNQSEDPSLNEAKSKIISYLQGFTENKDVSNAFINWLWQNPIPIGEGYALALAAGLLEKDNTKFPELVTRLYEIKDRSKVAFRIEFLWVDILLLPREVLMSGFRRRPELKGRLTKVLEENKRIRELVSFDETILK